MTKRLESLIREKAIESRELATTILREAVRIPASFVDQPPEHGGDPQCGLSNHEGPRLAYLRDQILEVGAVDSPADVTFDEFGNLLWTVEDPDDGIDPADKTIVLLDGHTDTVQALRRRWHEAIGGGVDPYEGLIEGAPIDDEFLKSELGHVPPESEWDNLLWGRGSADQLGGVACQIVATRLLRHLRAEGSLRGVIVQSYATVAEEDNDGGGPMFVLRQTLGEAAVEAMPDVVILTEGTGSAGEGALGIYRGQRGRMQIQVDITGKSCHGSMPWEGRNPLEYGGAIVAEAARHYREGRGFGEDPFLGKGSRTASWAALETPSDCAVPERFVIRFDRRLTAGEDPAAAVRDIDSLESVAIARAAGLQVDIHGPTYDQPTWRGYQPGNEQIYPGWLTPEEHPAIAAAVECYRRVITPMTPSGGGFPAEPRVSRWHFSTDGVGVPIPVDARRNALEGRKRWIVSGSFIHPAMFGIGPGYEQNTHKIGECVDTRELAPVIAFLARFPSLYRESVA